MSFFTRRHFIWFVQMTQDLQLSEYQIAQLVQLLASTNSRFNKGMFAEAILKAWMKN